MSNQQAEFEAFFADQTFGPRGGFEPRYFQIDCLRDYREFVKLPVVFGPSRIGFIVYGGTGCGKTKLAGLLASHALNVGAAQQVIVVVPNRSIRKKSREDFLKCFGIDLAVFNKNKHRDGIPRMQQGYILTYGAVMSDPTLHRRLCKGVKTLVIFDEIHHLGSHPESTWGAKSLEAFGEADHIIGLTGTPYRTEGAIPFVEYEPTAVDSVHRFKAHFTYPLGRAVADGYCRDPMFVFHYGSVKTRDIDGKESVVSFDDKISEESSRLRLRGAVVYGSTLRKDFLRRALERCRAENRKAIIFLGGDTCGEQPPTEDATGCLPLELQEFDYSSDQYEVVTGDDPTSLKRIEEFQNDPAKLILVSINMVSEGTDIPPACAAIFLTSVTAKQTTVQRIGRVLRLMENDPHKNGLIFMFADPEMMALARQIKDEIKAERILKKRREANGDGSGPSGPRRRPEAIGVGDAPMKCIIYNDGEFSAEKVEQAERFIDERGLPKTLLNAVLQIMMGA